MGAQHLSDLVAFVLQPMNDFLDIHSDPRAGELEKFVNVCKTLNKTALEQLDKIVAAAEKSFGGTIRVEVRNDDCLYVFDRIENVYVEKSGTESAAEQEA